MKTTVFFAIVYLLTCHDYPEHLRNNAVWTGEQKSIALARGDNAVQLTFSKGTASCQNPAFSPDGKSILYTRFSNGYNKGPSELIIINLKTREEHVLISSSEFDNVNSPGPSWVDGKITWSSDQANDKEEIFIVDEDGSNKTQVTKHPKKKWLYFEPVFNPKNPKKIVFEMASRNDRFHYIALLELDKGNRVTYLFKNRKYDARLPNWSWDGKMILFQRARIKRDNWRIYYGKIDFSGAKPVLNKLRKLRQPNSANTDNSFWSDNRFVLSSTANGGEIPHIWAISVRGLDPVRVSDGRLFEDGAPSASPDGKWVAFESHREAKDENSPSAIWIIDAPKALSFSPPL